MPDVDLSSVIPPEAKWVKIRYEMSSEKPGAELIARVWSGVLDDAVVLKGASGETVIKMNRQQTISYQRPVTVELKVKVVAYRTE